VFDFFFFIFFEVTYKSLHYSKFNSIHNPQQCTQEKKP